MLVLHVARFTKLLTGFDALKLKITLPDFHNLTLRYRQFEKALETGNPVRIEEARDLIAAIKQNKKIVDEFEICRSNKSRHLIVGSIKTTPSLDIRHLLDIVAFFYIYYV